jgi:hypothetical protein
MDDSPAAHVMRHAVIVRDAHQQLRETTRTAAEAAAEAQRAAQLADAQAAEAARQLAGR